MKIMILTQDEYLYLPSAFKIVCRDLGEKIASIVVLPAMSTHGGKFKGFLRVVRLFGFRPTTRLALMHLKARLDDALNPKSRDGNSIKAVASSHNIPFERLPDLKGSRFQDLLAKHEPDLLISISCPQIIGKPIRERFPQGCVNVHSSPLPRYRGLMPAFWQLKNGEAETAVTVHDLESKLDDGEIILQQAVKIDGDDTWDSLVRKTKVAGAHLLVEAVNRIEMGTAERRSNVESDGSYYGFPTKADRLVFLRNGRRFF